MGHGWSSPVLLGWIEVGIEHHTFIGDVMSRQQLIEHLEVGCLMLADVLIVWMTQNGVHEIIIANTLVQQID